VGSSVITRIEKTADGRYRIHADGQFLLSVHEDVLVKHRLHKGMEIDPEIIRELLSAEEYQRVKQAALRFLSHRPRTVHEVRKALLAKGYDAGLCDQVVEEMKELGYLDDRRFAESWVEERQTGKGLGIKRIRRELVQKGVASSLVDEALGHITDDQQRQLAMDVAERRYLRLRGETWMNIERKLGGFLLRRGFDMEHVISVLRELRLRYEDEEGKR
jgi:regulatory protein